MIHLKVRDFVLCLPFSLVFAYEMSFDRLFFRLMVSRIDFCVLGLLCCSKWLKLMISSVDLLC